MPKAASAAGTGAPVSGDRSNATELTSPVMDEEVSTPIDDSDELGSHREEEPDAPESKTPEDDSVAVPARLKGKPLAQVYQEFAGLEREYSRQGNELGEMRALFRQTLEQTLKQPRADSAQEDEPDPTPEEFDTDPQASVSKLVDKKLKPLRQAVATAEQRAMILEFSAKHPGFQAEAATPEFQEWVGASPYRKRMFDAAAKYDLDAAEDLFALWEERKAAVSDEPTAADQKKEVIKRNTTETGGAGKSAGKSGKKIYDSSKLIRLYNTDRDRYNEMMPEIQQAFKEGRVR